MSAIQIAGGFIDFQMGFSMANVIDPQTGVQSPLMGQLFLYHCLLFLLSTDGHHLLLMAFFIVIDSFRLMEHLSLLIINRCLSM